MRLNKLFLIVGIFFFLFLSINNVSALIISNTSAIDLTYTIGGQQPKPISIKFTNTENTSRVVVPTKTGTASSFIALNPDVLSFSSNVSLIQSVSFSVTSTTPGLYSSQINYEDGYIPVYINVIQNTTQTTGCRLKPIFNRYYKTVKRSAPSSSETFSIFVEDCTSVNVNQPIVVGQITNSQGTKEPISFSEGGISTGIKTNGQSVSFTINFKADEMDLGTYGTGDNLYVKVYGIDSVIGYVETQIFFEVTVTEGISPTTGNITFLPSYNIPSTIAVNEPFEITANDMNPNLEAYVFPNEYLNGLVCVSQNCVFRAKTNKTGSFDLKMITRYRGKNQIGEVITRTISVSGTGTQQSSNNISLYFYPRDNLTDYKGGETLTMVCRDAGSGVQIHDCIITVNGIVMSNKSINLIDGYKYSILASHPNYNTNEKIFTISEKSLEINIPLVYLEEASAISINVDNVEVKLDGVSIFNNTFILHDIANHTLTFSKPGYEQVTKYVTAVKRLQTLLVPEQDKVKRNKEYIIEWNKEASWKITLSKKDKETEEVKETLYAEGTGNSLNFQPKDKGIYYIDVDGQRIATYDLNTGNWFTEQLFSIWGLIFVVVIIVIIILLISGRKSEEGDTPGFYPKGDE